MTTDPPPPSTARTDRVDALVVATVPLVLAVPLLWGDRLLYRDTLHYFLVNGVKLADALRAGRWPEWDPMLLGGIPFLADPGSGALYPPNLLYLAFDPLLANTLVTLLHLPVAALGAWWLARRLGLDRAWSVLAGIVYCTSGYVLSMHGGGLYLSGAALLPVLLASRLAVLDGTGTQGIVPAAVASCVAFLSGEWQAPWLAALVAGVWALTSRDGRVGKLLRLGVVEALGASLAAVQLWPTLSFARESVRASGLSVEQSAQLALHPVRWLEFLAPQPFGLPFPDNGSWAAAFVTPPWTVPWSVSLYVGAALVVAAFVGWRGGGARWTVLAVAGLVALLVAAGGSMPVHGLFHAVVPIANRFRYPEKYAGFVTLVLVLAGLRGLSTARPVTWRILLGGVAVLLLGAAGGVTLWDLPGDEAITAGLLRAGATIDAASARRALAGSLVEGALAATVTWLALEFVRERTGPWKLVPVVVIACVSVLPASRLLSFGVPPTLDAPPLAQAIRDATPPGSTGRVLLHGPCRYASPKEPGTTLLERVRDHEVRGLKENFGHLWGVPSAVGYTASFPGRFEQLRAAATGLDAFGRARLVAAAVVVRCEGDRNVAYPVPGFAPRLAFLEAFPVPDADARVTAPGFAPSSVAYVPALSGHVARAPDATARWVRDEPEFLEITTSGGGGVLVLTDRFAPGWTATVDGTEVPILLANGLWRALEVPAGDHRVRMYYRTPGLAGGLVVSGLAALVGGVLLLLGNRRRGGLSNA